MNVPCQTARAWIKAIRSDSESVDDSRWELLAEHLEGCAGCDQEFVLADALDEAIGVAMRDVPVPAGGADAVLAALAGIAEHGAEQASEHGSEHGSERSADSSGVDRGLPTEKPSMPEVVGPARVSPIAGEDSGRTSGSRRRALVAIASTVAVALVAVIWQGWDQDDPQPLAVRDIEQQLPDWYLGWESLPELQQTALAVLPQVGWSRAGIDPEIRGWSPRENEPQVAAVYRFRATSQRGPVVEGVLAVMDSGTLQEPPSSRVFDPGTVVYSTRGGEHFASVSWVEGDRVYFCVVRNDPGALDQLEDILSGRTV